MKDIVYLLKTSSSCKLQPTLIFNYFEFCLQTSFGNVSLMNVDLTTEAHCVLLHGSNSFSNIVSMKFMIKSLKSHCTPPPTNLKSLMMRWPNYNFLYIYSNSCPLNTSTFLILQITSVINKTKEALLLYLNIGPEMFVRITFLA
jgi:hypothetical protein